MKFAWLPLTGWLLAALALAAFLWPGLGLAATRPPGNQEKIMSPLPRKTQNPSVKVPPLDTVSPAKIETATFALG
jgi:hypothetical protein